MSGPHCSNRSPAMARYYLSSLCRRRRRPAVAWAMTNRPDRILAKKRSLNKRGKLWGHRVSEIWVFKSPVTRGSEPHYQVGAGTVNRYGTQNGETAPVRPHRKNLGHPSIRLVLKGVTGMQPFAINRWHGAASRWSNSAEVAPRLVLNHGCRRMNNGASVKGLVRD